MEKSLFLQQINHARFQGQPYGHYESYFLRANHPSRPLAFWIRYTIFSPKDHPDNAMGELWAIFFNGETDHHQAVKQEFPLSECKFDTSTFDVRVGNSTLRPFFAQGEVVNKDISIQWDLEFHGHETPIFLLPLKLYKGKFPAAKSLVSLPLAKFTGRLTVNDEIMEIDGWNGSQNHNWGSRHTDLYAWGQVAGFDSHPDSFLEVATARLHIGPVWTPPITPIVLRHRQKEYAITGLLRAIQNRGDFHYFTWKFSSKISDLEIEGQITAPSNAFVGLNYYNPPGGVKHCLNTKIASCKLRIKDRSLGITDLLETGNCAAFEILTNDLTHGVRIVA